ncbi:MAG: GAF domain-containing protein [Bacteroidota bacterium]
MQFIPFKKKLEESPLRVLLCLEKQIDYCETFAKDKDHPYHKISKEVLKMIEDAPLLRAGIEDMSLLPQYEKEINLLFAPLFPKQLQMNEIKSVVIPFQFTAFHLSQRFQNIIKNAGPDFRLDMESFGERRSYFFACSFILKAYYKQSINFNRPVFMHIPDQTKGITRHYRAMFNVDFIDIIKTEKAPDITQEDIDELLLRGEDLEFWKSKFPPNSYILKGFGIANLFDVTNDVILSDMRSVFLRNDEGVFKDFKENLINLMGIKDLMVGYSIQNAKPDKPADSFMKRTYDSIILDEDEQLSYHEIFCDYVRDTVLHNSEVIAISDIEKYGERSGKNHFYKKMKKKGIKSIILVPLKLNNGLIQLLEMASTRKNELNMLSAYKLEDIIPFVKIAAERYIEEGQNVLESTIQENYTSIHPTVKWRFTQAVSEFIDQKNEGVEDPALERIVFDEVYPLYAQSDIKGSSTARNAAIQADLSLQLSLVIKTFQKIMEVQSFPIYDNLVYRVQECLDHVNEGIKAGDEVSILEFLKGEIYPVFDHLKTLNPTFEAAVNAYIARIDPQLHVVYQQRKSYEDSVNTLNNRLAAYLDKEQIKAQEMFPHYYERYKTDGVEFNMYIGASLVNDDSFNLMYLQNLRLWQLQVMCELEQLAFDLVDELPYALRVASLILIHSNPLAIQFSMEQKQFDVDGAYNARYEIVKKRIDKSHIKGTNERLTQPGKIAIVYSQDRDTFEYLNYIKYLQSKNLLGKIEMLDLEDLQGVSGLKAIRVEVLYQPKAVKRKNGQTTITEGKGEMVEVKK